MPLVKKWIDNHIEATPFYLSYFGTANPAYHGVKARILPSYIVLDKIDIDARPLTDGSYFISASQLQGVFLAPLERWNEKLEKVYQNVMPIALKYNRVKHNKKLRNQLITEVGEAKFAKILKTFESLQFARLCAHLRTREPDEALGYSILVYRLSGKDISRYTSAPPPM